MEEHESDDSTNRHAQACLVVHELEKALSEAPVHGGGFT